MRKKTISVTISVKKKNLRNSNSPFHLKNGQFRVTLWTVVHGTKQGDLRGEREIGAKQRSPIFFAQFTFSFGIFCVFFLVISLFFCFVFSKIKSSPTQLYIHVLLSDDGYQTILLFIPGFLKTGLAKISTHCTTWPEFKTIKLIQRPIKSLNLTPGSK